MSKKTNGEVLMDWLHSSANTELSPYSPVNRIAKAMGWGWHRTYNALKAEGYR